MGLTGSKSLEQMDLETSDSNSVCNNLMNELKKIGIQTDFPASKLRTGQGEHVLKVLEWLSENALKHARFEMQKPAYSAPKNNGIKI